MEEQNEQLPEEGVQEPKNDHKRLILPIIITAILIIAMLLGYFLFFKQENKPKPSISVEESNEQLAKSDVKSSTESVEISKIDYQSSNQTVVVTEDDNYRYIKSNGLPDHETGKFPNPGNPNTISEQNVNYRMTLSPTKNNEPTPAQVPGIAYNGVIFEPGTAEKFVANDGTVWNIEAFQDKVNLGLDYSNAHVQPTGLYHYHGTPAGLLGEIGVKSGIVQVGWAADGFPVYVDLNDRYQSSWKLKSGSRGSANSSPGGNYDGTYTQDFEFIAGSGQLDQCNGTVIDGEYGYFITKTFPYISRCLYGTPDPSFAKQPGIGPGPNGLLPPPPNGQLPPPKR